ncbi:hypothetical protein GCM10007390_20300 [Persicitalea jodogahamensis]|uniref:Uncharacterized protein n=1 Tax=Persicitalea jodogahamensis TaxID=402147 RepID=A0A8J3D3L4_9BACT|nr:hypothetical protein GCM10007390_20300 [Persicitalea jodogahamensis]
MIGGGPFKGKRTLMMLQANPKKLIIENDSNEKVPPEAYLWVEPNKSAGRLCKERQSVREGYSAGNDLQHPPRQPTF